MIVYRFVNFRHGSNQQIDESETYQFTVFTQSYLQRTDATAFYNLYLVAKFSKKKKKKKGTRLSILQHRKQEIRPPALAKDPELRSYKMVRHTIGDVENLLPLQVGVWPIVALHEVCRGHKQRDS